MGKTLLLPVNGKPVNYLTSRRPWGIVFDGAATPFAAASMKYILQEGGR
jgi:hypothetical protein